MSVSTRHPDYVDRIDEWAMMRATARGETAVKAAGEDYLPMPSGFRTQPDGGRAMYAAYQKRAQFAEIVAPTVRGMIGVIHRAEAQIEMPSAMEEIWERATADGLPLEALHRRITRELLLMGRYGLLADAASEGSELPWIAGYTAEALINWSPRRDFFVLDESGPDRDGFTWRHRRAYRVLELRDGRYAVDLYGDDAGKSGEATPTARGGAALGEIPFVVIGPSDLSVTPEEPPLIGVARAALAMYRLDADYRHQLYMSGQETLVIINGDPPSAVGAGVVLSLKASKDDHMPDAKYVGPAGTGIDAHRVAIQDERANAAAAGARLFDTEKRSAESGDALRIRYAAQTATLTSIAQASAQGLEKALRYIAVMIGASPDEVVVKPNLSFIEAGLSPQEALNLVKVWQEGAISYETLYDNLQRGEIASAERDADEERDLIDREDVAEGYEDAGALTVPSAVSDAELRELFAPELIEGA